MKKQLLMLVALVLAGSVISAQDKPPSWNRMTATQQSVWVANCQPPSERYATMCAALAGGKVTVVERAEPSPTPKTPVSTAVCKDGKRFALPRIDTADLTEKEIGEIHQNNANSACVGHGPYPALRTAANVLKILSGQTAEQTESATAAVSPAQTALTSADGTPASQPAARQPETRACAENGSCYGEPSATTGAPKTTHVDGYYRKDGTYVRGHYRSKGK